MLTSHYYFRNHKDVAYKQFSPFYRLSIFLKNKRFFSKPLLAIGVLVLKILEYFFAALGYLMGQIKNQYA